MNLASRLGIALPASAALAIATLYGLEAAGFGAAPPPPVASGGAPAEEGGAGAQPPETDAADQDLDEGPEDAADADAGGSGETEGDESEGDESEAGGGLEDDAGDGGEGGEGGEGDAGAEAPADGDAGDLPGPAAPLDFPHNPPGELLETTIEFGNGDPAELGSTAHLSEAGYTEPLVFAPDMRFPMLRGPAYANSQIFLPAFGAAYYPPRGRDEENAIVDVYIDGVRYARPWGPQNSPGNYAYPWSDNYCEIRYSDVNRCSGTDGHQGQDIRPGSCTHNHVVVAADDGFVSTLSNLSLDLYADDEAGTVYRYLHVDRPLLIDMGEDNWVAVEKGQPLGFVSNVSGRSMPLQRLTTVHLHFEVWAGSPGGADPLPLYTSLVEAYRRLGAEDPSNHESLPAVGDCTYPDGAIGPTRAEVIAALEALAQD